jgi:hypothetical protein
MIGLAAIVVVIVVITAAAIVLLGKQGTQGNKNYTLNIGDFVKYHMTSTNTENGLNYTYEILGLNSTTIFQKQTNERNDVVDWVGYNNLTRNQSWFAIDLSNPPPGTSVTHLGTEDLQLKWGLRSTEHYSVTTSTRTYEVWTRYGIIAKMQLNSESVSATIMLIDSNMPQFTD